MFSLIRSIILFGVIFLFTPSQFALAHPGGLDKKGGHVNKKTGIYHYHKKKQTTKKTPPKEKTPATKKKSEANDKKTVETPEDEEYPFAIFDRLTAENQKQPSTSKPVIKKPVLQHAVLKTERSNSKAIIYVQLTHEEKTFPSQEDLMFLSRKLDSGQRFLVYFFLPTMDINKSPWATAVETGEKKLMVTRFDKRAPKAFRDAAKKLKLKNAEIKTSEK